MGFLITPDTIITSIIICGVIGFLLYQAMKLYVVTPLVHFFMLRSGYTLYVYTRIPGFGDPIKRYEWHRNNDEAMKSKSYQWSNRQIHVVKTK